MSGCGLRLVLAAVGAAGLVGLLAPTLAVGQERGEQASPETVEATVLAETQETVQYVSDRLVVGFEETASSAPPPPPPTPIDTVASEVEAVVEEVEQTVPATN